MATLKLLFAIGGTVAFGIIVVAWIAGWLSFRTALKGALFVVLFCLINLPLTYYFGIHTLKSEKRCTYDNGSECRGYDIRYDSWGNQTLLSIWTDNSLGVFPGESFFSKEVIDGSAYKSYFGQPKIEEEQWFVGSWAVYLRFSAHMDNSAPYETKVEILYDFAKHKMYSNYGLPETRAEFQQALETFTYFTQKQ